MVAAADSEPASGSPRVAHAWRRRAEPRDLADSELADLAAAAESQALPRSSNPAKGPGRLGHRRLGRRGRLGACFASVVGCQTTRTSPTRSLLCFGVCFASEFALLRSLLCWWDARDAAPPSRPTRSKCRVSSSPLSEPLVRVPLPWGRGVRMPQPAHPAPARSTSPAGPERATSGHSSGGGAGPGRGGLKKASIAQVEGRGAVSRAIARKDSRTHPGGGPHPRTHPFNINWSVYYPPRPRPAPPPLLRPDEGPTRARLAGAPGRRRVSRVRLL